MLGLMLVLLVVFFAMLPMPRVASHSRKPRKAGRSRTSVIL